MGDTNGDTSHGPEMVERVHQAESGIAVIENEITNIKENYAKKEAVRNLEAKVFKWYSNWTIYLLIAIAAAAVGAIVGR